MTDPESIDRLLYDLRERAKELNCLYEVQELLNTPDIGLDEICGGIINIIPPGWQYPEVCQAKIICFGNAYTSPNFKESQWVQRADIIVQDDVVGTIDVFYTEERPQSDEGPFLKEERKLIDTIAGQLGFHILHRQLKEVFQEHLKSDALSKSEWVEILDLLRRTDPDLLARLTRKMIAYLGWSGVKEVEQLLKHTALQYSVESILDDNKPSGETAGLSVLEISDEVFALAGKHLSREAVFDNIQKWSQEDRISFLIEVLVNPSSSLSEIRNAIERYQLLAKQGIELTPSRERWLRIALLRRIMSDQPEFIQVAQNYLSFEDFGNYFHQMIFPANSHGRLGGKSSGLILAKKILNDIRAKEALVRDIKTPKSWYLASDLIFQFMSYNDLEDVVEQKYRDLAQVRQDYTYIMHMFKNSHFPPEILKELSLALDDFGDVPLIVRSSSLLEDRTGVAFAGKYKSLFIANKGTKEERLSALSDAIAEVYASMFGPDPIEYRSYHGLIDYHEEMGILIQEVVGTLIGRYYLPAFAGIAFSQNEYRWSSRIQRKDGLIRMVPGLGTRAVDRVSDDYPVLIAPGKPALRVNTTAEEVVRYSPRKIDVINLETGGFETIEARTLLREFGSEFPLAEKVLSIYDHDQIREPSVLGINFEKDEVIVTFKGLFTSTDFLQSVKTILESLEEVLGLPVDIEFAHDGTCFYLLQCRMLSNGSERKPSPIPKMLPPEDIVFTADRYVTNGSVVNVTHIVYVDSAAYANLEKHQDLLAVGRAIGHLNQILPKRGFILIGPGRWGSRGDIKMGVNVTYSDIRNTSMLIEVSKQREDYAPEPSFGTHFFQDLVEASIYYLPLYPDQEGIIFNEAFLLNTENALGNLAPDFAHLSNVVRVLNIPDVTGGRVLHVHMNADIGKAIAFLSDPLDSNTH
jgi:pyruvate,water dikinase